jgi:hypothetical protein
VIVDECGWPTPSPTPPDEANPADKMPFSDFIAGGKLDLSDVLDPLVAQFKRDTGIE